MSRYRNIHCLIWNDDKFPFTSDDCQLVWFHLFTTPMTNPIGLYKAPIEGLAAEKRWKIDKYKKAFAEGIAKGFWKYDERFHVIYFPKFFQHNKPGNPNVLKAWVKHYSEVPNCELKNESIQSLKAFTKAWGKPFESITESIGVTFAKQEQEQEQEQEQDKDLPKKNGHCPSQKIIEAYHRILPELPEVKDETQIKQKIAARWKADKSRQSIEWWDAFFINEIKQSDFLMGKKTDFHATLDWISGPQNFSKILNGLYKNKDNKPKMIRIECDDPV